MSLAESNLLTECAAEARRIVEYGCGGSTIMLCQSSRAHIWSVESDPVWIERLRANLNSYGDRVTILHADIGPVKGWGYPAQIRDSYDIYWKIPWSSTDGADLTLVDGRFRVCCALYSALKGSRLILVHDFFRRSQYQVLLKHLRMLDSDGQLAVFQRKPSFSILEAVREIHRYERDSR